MKPSRKTRAAARRLFRRCFDHGRFDDDRARGVARQLAVSGRRGSLPILSDFLRLVRLDVDERTAVVESAAPLSREVRERVNSRLVDTYGAGLTTSFAVNPALVGGMRIKVGSEVYDGSVRARLAALERRL